MAALLAVKDEGALSHRSAAQLWDLLPYPAAAPVWVTVAPGRSAARPRLKVIRAVLDPNDRRHRHDMTVTSPPRTVLDMAALLAEPNLERLVGEAHYRRLASESELETQLQRNPGRRGTRKLHRVLGLGPRMTRSDGEHALLSLLRDAGIGGFEPNARIGGYEVDLLWREKRLVVELDGYDGHSGQIAFERDRAKGAALTGLGLAVMHVTGRQLAREPKNAVTRIEAALGSRPT